MYISTPVTHELEGHANRWLQIVEGYL